MEVLMSQAVEEAAAETPGKISLAMEAYAKALREIPRAVADNGGYDSSALLTEMRAQHKAGNKTLGLDMNAGAVGDMATLGILVRARHCCVRCVPTCTFVVAVLSQRLYF